MKKFASLLLFSLFLMKPLFAMDGPQQQDPDIVSIAGLKHEHVLLALWNSASGGNDPMGQVLFLAANTKNRPTEDMAKQYLHGPSSGGYFCTRKVSPPSGDTYYCKPFNDNHGNGRAQLIIQALQERSLVGPMTLEDIFKIYIPVPANLGTEKQAEMEALRKAGKFEEATMTQAYALREKEDARMQAFVKMGNMEAAMAIFSARSRREDAEVGGFLTRTLAQDGTAEQRVGAKDFNRGMAVHLARQTGGKSPFAPKAYSSAPPPSPTQSPPPQSKTDAQNDLSVETQKVLAEGLRGMFGGAASKKPEPKK
jgi:hypothetical protein